MRERPQVDRRRAPLPHIRRTERNLPDDPDLRRLALLAARHARGLEERGELPGPEQGKPVFSSDRGGGEEALREADERLAEAAGRAEGVLALEHVPVLRTRPLHV